MMDHWTHTSIDHAALESSSIDSGLRHGESSSCSWQLALWPIVSLRQYRLWLTWRIFWIKRWFHVEEEVLCCRTFHNVA